MQKTLLFTESYLYLLRAFWLSIRSIKRENIDLWERSDILFKRAIELNSKNPDFYYLWGVQQAKFIFAYANEKVSDEILISVFSKFSKTIEIDPDYSSAYYSWGYYLYCQALNKEDFECEKLLDLSIQKLEEGLRINDKAYNALNLLGNIYMLKAANEIEDKGRIEELLNKAEQMYKKALMIQPKCIDIINSLGNIFFERIKINSKDDCDYLFTQAYQKYQEALKVKRNSETLYNWGSVLAHQARKKSGEEADRLFALSYEKFDKALKIRSNMACILYNWGYALKDQAKTKNGTEADQLFNLANEKFEVAFKLEPDDYSIISEWGLNILAQAQRKSGVESRNLTQKAKEKLLLAAKSNPENAYYLLSYLSIIAGDEVEAKKWLEMSLDLGGKDIYDYLSADDHFALVKEAKWFKETITKYKSKA